MKIESQKSNHKSGFIVLSVLLSYLLFVEAHLYNEYYDDNYQLARRHISSGKLDPAKAHQSNRQILLFIEWPSHSDLCVLNCTLKNPPER